MAFVIRAVDNHNQPIVDESSPHVPEIYFNLVRVPAGETLSMTVPGIEIVAVMLSGTCAIGVDGQQFDGVGQRADIWSGKADSVYLGTGRPFTVTAGSSPVEIALAGTPSSADFAPFRIAPDAVESVVVGSSATKSKREIFHILGQNGAGRTGNLLVSELYAEDGCWSGYPPHKHDEDRQGETNHAELYHYRYEPPTGFGVQVHYRDGETGTAELLHTGDTFVIPEGYHPTVTSPGHRAYVFTILVGRTQRGLVQYFDPVHAHLADYIPGLGAMRDKFK